MWSLFEGKKVEGKKVEGKGLEMVSPNAALPGRAEAMPVAARHWVLDAPLRGVFAAPSEEAIFAMGCFWGAERLFWQMPGVISTAVGYAGGFTPNPTYREVCTGQTGHAEVVKVAFDPTRTSYAALLKAFWEGHDPTQGMRQGNDRGTQYRSAIYTTTAAQAEAAVKSRLAYAQALKAAGYADITTEIASAGPFYFAEDEHQQYLAKNPHGYCGLGGSGIPFAEI